jgi:MFS family permease
MTRRIHYAWFVAATTFIVLLCAAAVRATPSVIIVPLQNEFGWSRALISGAISINLVLYGLVGPFAAAIMQRFGIRRTIMVALAIMAIGVALTNLMTAPWQLYACWGILVGIAAGSTATVLGATIVQRWFATRRGLMMGILTASAATGQLVFLPIMAAYVVSDG